MKALRGILNNGRPRNFYKIIRGTVKKKPSVELVLNQGLAVDFREIISHNIIPII